jgi:hypothetical protein
MRCTNDSNAHANIRPCAKFWLVFFCPLSKVWVLEHGSGSFHGVKCEDSKAIPFAWWKTKCLFYGCSLKGIISILSIRSAPLHVLAPRLIAQRLVLFEQTHLFVLQAMFLHCIHGHEFLAVVIRPVIDELLTGHFWLFLNPYMQLYGAWISD